MTVIITNQHGVISYRTKIVEASRSVKKQSNGTPLATDRFVAVVSRSVHREQSLIIINHDHRNSEQKPSNINTIVTRPRHSTEIREQRVKTHGTSTGPRLVSQRYIGIGREVFQGSRVRDAISMHRPRTQ